MPVKGGSPAGYPNPEDARDPMMAPQDYEIRQSGRSPGGPKPGPLVATNRHVLAFSYLLTIREEPLKNCRPTTSEKWKAKKDKIEEAKQKKTKKGDDAWNYAGWQPSSWSWQQPMTWVSSSSSSQQQWSSDQNARAF